jgi:hypothetical protein
MPAEAHILRQVTGTAESNLVDAPKPKPDLRIVN